MTCRGRILRLSGTFAAVAILAFLTSSSEADDNPHLVVRQRIVNVDSGFVAMRVCGLAPGTAEQAWELLTRLDQLAGFMPGIDSSYVLARSDTSWIVRQVVTTRVLLPWTFRMDLEFVPDAGSHVLRFRRLRGSLHDYSGHWTIDDEEGGEGVLLRYEARARLRHPLPAFLVRYIVGRQMDRMMPAFLRELAGSGRLVRSEPAGGNGL